MAKVTIWVKGEQTGEALAKLFGAEEYKTIGNEWQTQFDTKHHQNEISELMELVNTEYALTVCIKVEDGDDWIAGDVVTLSQYESDGCVYSDAGNGGEDVEKDRFDIALNLLFFNWNRTNDLVAELFGGFWEDTVTDGYYLRYKN